MNKINTKESKSSVIGENNEFITLFEKIGMIILLILGCLPIITIPYFIFIFKSKRITIDQRKKLIVYYYLGLSFAFIINSYIFYVFFNNLDVDFSISYYFPSSLWIFIQTQPNYLYIQLLSMGIFAVLLNRITVLIYNTKEEEFCARSYTRSTVTQGNNLNGWMKLKRAIQWKNKPDLISSQEETLLKVKNSSKILSIACFCLLICSFFVVNGYDLSGILNEVIDMEFNRDFNEYILGAIYAIILGLFYIISNTATWFYSGRMISYFGIYSIPIKKGQKSPIPYIFRIVGYLISLFVLIPGILFLFNFEISIIFMIETIISMLFIIFLGIIIVQFVNNHEILILDPKGARKNLDNQNNWIKKFVFGLFIAGIISISILNGILWFPSVFLYAQTVIWYEWTFYLFLGIIFIIGPVLLLFALNSIYVRRILMIYLVIILVILVQLIIKVMPFKIDLAYMGYSFIFGQRLLRTEDLNLLSMGSKPIQVISIWYAFFMAILCIIILKKGAFPIKTSENKYLRWNTIKDLILFIKQKNQYLMKSQKVIGIIFLLSFFGISITMIPENSTIRLYSPAGHELNVSFWTSEWRFNNDTLDVLNSYNIRLFAWIDGYNVSEMVRYAEHGVEVVKVLSFRSSISDWGLTYTEADNLMDLWDTVDPCPFIGFTFDIEKWNFIHEVNETWYEEICNVVGDFIDHVNSRGYQVFITEYMLTIPDLLDGDYDISILDGNPFDINWNAAHFDWMVYRAEQAINYNEPHEYFTYQWANQIKNLMLKIGGHSLLAKSSMSIGVTTDKLPLYQGPNGLNEFIKDVKICHAMEISNIIIFYVGNDPGDDNYSFFSLYGIDGLHEMMNQLNTYTYIDIPFKRRTTFLGNLKMEQNPTGSVFGFIYQDFWMEKYFEFIVVFCLILTIFLPMLTSSIKSGFKNKKEIQEIQEINKIKELKEMVRDSDSKPFILLKSMLFFIIGIIIFQFIYFIIS